VRSPRCSPDGREVAFVVSTTDVKEDKSGSQIWTVGFDGRVQLDMVVLPFGSWRSAVERGNVPVLGGVLAKLAGKAQQIVGKASGALYAFRITGTVQDPRLTPVPVPALTKSATDALERLASDAAKDE
jgi:hypothetical protein